MFVFRSGPPLLLVFVVIIVLFGLFVFLPMSILATAFGKLGLTGFQGMAVFLATIFGSSVNIPLHKGTRLVRGLAAPASRLFRMQRVRPGQVGFGQMNFGQANFGQAQDEELMLSEQVVAVNVGGCVVPCLLSAWFLWQIHATGMLGGWLALCVVISALACYLLARPTPGVGIAVPVLLPPAVAALTAILLSPDVSTLPGHESLAPRAAYMAGTLGTLIGADILHLANRRTWAMLDAPLLSIGGAGTFDGIFLAGIIAVLLA
ncbi:MAG: DUF1614 domain-containing protein [Humidesulfovibrio sp.]|uniref:DUF1614 domain-containing protein n=1 Tax=Humidesulfovibrio sp. TaxID=2910988 RepID=UPI0027FFF226|nr:DUF1614 domain-containing protein [Humidesulfovibrio sp.]MDQ7834116.1 DUF1614 domain-containing protein [Humidesulfovibrio sp.]